MTEPPDMPAPVGTELSRPVRRRPDPIFVVIAGVAVGVIVAAIHHAQPGMFIVAGALAFGAVLRLVLRPRDAGSLVVRSRHVDVAMLTLLAAAVGVIAALTPFPAGR